MPLYPGMDWDLPSGGAITWEQAQLAVLMDIRRALDVVARQTSSMANYTSNLGCSNAQAIPNLLRRIARNTSPERKPAKSHRRAVALARWRRRRR